MADNLLFSLSPKSVYSPIRSVAGSSSSSSLLPQLFHSQVIGFGLRRLPEIPLFCFSAKDPAWQSQRLPFRAPRTRCSEEYYSSICSLFSPAKFFAAASNFSSSTVTGPDKVAYPMLKHLPRSGMDFLLDIFNLS